MFDNLESHSCKSSHLKVNNPCGTSQYFDMVYKLKATNTIEFWFLSVKPILCAAKLEYHS